MNYNKVIAIRQPVLRSERGKKREVADQQTFEDGLCAETSRKRQRELNKRKTFCIKIVVSKVQFSEF